MGVMVLFHLQKMFSFRYFLKKDWCIGFIFYTQVYNHTIGQVRFRVKSVNYYESNGPFFNFIFLQNAYVWLRMALGGGGGGGGGAHF